MKKKIKFVAFGYIFAVFGLLAGVLGFGGSARAAQQVMNYGYEDWDGSADTTPEYPWASGYNEYWTTHKNMTEVVESYESNTGGIWTPHSGNYFSLHRNSPDYALNPPVDGITSGAVNNNIYIGLSPFPSNPDYPEYGGPGRYDCSFDQIETGEFFLRFWARHNKGFSTIEGSGNCKWIVVGTDGGIYGTIYMHLTTFSTNPDMKFYCGDEGTWLGSSVQCQNAYDGNWHKYSLYINFNTGVIRGWYDVENETAENATKTWTAPDGKIGNCTRATDIHIEGNFSAKQPTEVTYHALDDIEIWDGMPNQTDFTPPSRSNPQPTGTLSSGTTSTTISLDTDETAACKYSTTAGTDYDSIHNTFSTTNSTTHSQTITNLSDGNSYTYYIRCQDTARNANTDDFTISFSIASSTTYSISNFINLVTDWLKTESGLVSDVNNDG
ncbi:MAG: hypothetical protein U9N86_18110, partial [Bacteroidota bacterium]|nr:hypothetical protein [Bacteroidota bacterium]